MAFIDPMHRNKPNITYLLADEISDLTLQGARVSPTFILYVHLELF